MDKRFWKGKTGTRTESGRCSECDWSNFEYNNGNEFSEDGVRGYRCVNCSTVKPERFQVSRGAVVGSWDGDAGEATLKDPLEILDPEEVEEILANYAAL